MANRSPSFQFYPRDILADPAVELMTAEEFGGYCRLLCHAWHSDQPGHLPNDPVILAGLSRLGTEGWARCSTAVQRAFKVSSTGTLFNKRMTEEWAKQQGRCKQASAAGKASAEAKALEKKRRSSASTTVQRPLKISCPSVPTKLNPASASASALKDPEEDHPLAGAHAHVKGHLPEPAAGRRSAEPASDLTGIWQEHVGTSPGSLSDLIRARDLVTDYARHTKRDPAQLLPDAFKAFRDWVDGCPASRRPRKSPMKFHEHWERIQEIVDGRQPAVPDEKPERPPKRSGFREPSPRPLVSGEVKL